MDLTGLNTTLCTVVGVMALIGAANLMDCGFRTMAEKKARRAEMARLVKWGLPSPRSPEEPKRDEHLWHF
jgi:hypothetical protein